MSDLKSLRLLVRKVQAVLLIAAFPALAAGMLVAAWLPGLSTALLVSLLVTAAVLIVVAGFSVERLLRIQLRARFAALAALLQREEEANANPVPWQATGDTEVDRLANMLIAQKEEIATCRRGLEYVATHDALTGLGNRRYIGERLAQALNHTRNHPHTPISLMLVDVEGFKLINDGLGHSAGDAALCEVGKRLRALLRPNDCLARLGGDEFALLLYDLRAGDAGDFFSKLQKCVALPINLDRRTMNLGVSAGIAEGVTGMTAHDWQRRADLAMLAAKREGRNRLVAFRDSMQTDAARQLLLEQALRLAIANDDLQVYFQPVIDGRNGHVLGLEALCRWTHDGEVVEPIEFIRVAESSSQISSLGRAVLAGACRALAGLRHRHPRLRCGVNLSIGQFVDGDIEADLLAAVGAAGLPLNALRLEITESLVATHESGVVPLMHRLVEKGAEFCLDDFGTGFSSLDRLRQLPIKGLKIDRSFVTPLQRGDEVMVRHIVALSRDLGLDTVAEGVETEDERRRLCEIGCPAMQGFLLARPMPASELAAWLEHRVVSG